MKKFIDSLIEKYELSKEYQAEQQKTFTIGNGTLSNGRICQVVITLKPGDPGDRQFKEMPKSFVFKGAYPELNAPLKDKKKRRTL